MQELKFIPKTGKDIFFVAPARKSRVRKHSAFSIKSTLLRKINRL